MSRMMEQMIREAVAQQIGYVNQTPGSHRRSQATRDDSHREASPLQSRYTTEIPELQGSQLADVDNWILKAEMALERAGAPRDENDTRAAVQFVAARIPTTGLAWHIAKEALQNG